MTLYLHSEIKAKKDVVLKTFGENMSNKILDAIEIVVASKTTHQDIEFLQNFIYQSFIIGCRHFLKKRRLYQTTGTNQTLLFSAGIFAVVIFVCSL